MQQDTDVEHPEPGPVSPREQHIAGDPAAMPTSSMFFTPSRTKNKGMISMKPIADTCPRLWIPAVLVNARSLRKGFVNE